MNQYPPNATASQNIQIYLKNNQMTNYTPTVSDVSYNNNLMMKSNYNNENNIYDNNSGLMQNNNNNTINESKNLNKKNDIEDPDMELFSKDEDKKDNKKDDQKVDDDLSDEDEDDKESSDSEKEYKDSLLTQYEEVKRIKNKWKVKFKNCVLQKDGKEFVSEKLTGVIGRDW